MDLIWKLHLPRGRLMRRLVLRTFMLVLAAIVVSLTQIPREIRVMPPLTLNADECPFDLDSYPNFNLTSASSSFALPLVGVSELSIGETSANLTRALFQELMEKNLLKSDATTLCVGKRSASAVLALRHMGFFSALGADRHPYFSLFKRGFVYELDFEDNYFDFVFSEDLARISVPALLVREIERVLQPGGTGAMLVGARELYSNVLIRPAYSIASFLKSSNVIHICNLGSFNLVIFKKRIASFTAFEHFQLPSTCPAVANNEPFMKYIEPLVDKIPVSYLPNFLNISSRNKLVYINVGAGEYARTAITKLSKPYCANHHAAFEVFIIDHKTSILSSYVTEPGIHFVYHPALAGNVSTAPDVNSDEFLSAPVDDEGFDFVPWFKETVSDGDFVVLMMNSKLAELNILMELFKTGEICHVDELFLKCSDDEDCVSVPAACGGCTNLVKSLRKKGLFVHQWFGDY